MILKNEQYKIIREYFQLNENLDSESFKSFVNDLEKLDLDQQKETIQKLQKFIYKKTKEINKKKKELSEEDFYNRNKDVIEKIDNILKDSYLKKIDKIFNLKRFTNLKLERDYTNEFRKLSNKNINSKIEDNLDIPIDRITLRLKNNFQTWEDKVEVIIEIKQIYNYKNVHFKLRLLAFLPSQMREDFNKFKNIDLPNCTLEYIIKKLNFTNTQLDQIEIALDAQKYNL